MSSVQPWRRPFAAWRLTNLGGHTAESVTSAGMDIVFVLPVESTNTFMRYTDEDGTEKEGYHLSMAAPYYGGDSMGVWVPKGYNGTDGIVDDRKSPEWTATPCKPWEQDTALNQSLMHMEPWFFEMYKTSLMREGVWSRISDANQTRINRAVSRVPTLQELASASLNAKAPFAHVFV